jgi:hypothetical protein
MDNNVVGIQLDALIVDQIPVDGGPSIALLEYNFGSSFFVLTKPMQDTGIFNRAFGIVDQLASPEFLSGTYTQAVGSGTYVNFGTLSYGLQNLELFVVPNVPEAFGIYDTNSKQLFEVTGSGIVLVNKIARQTANTAPTISAYPALGTGAAVAIAAGGTDSAFQVQISTGTGPTGGNIYHVTFATPFLTKPVITFSPEGASNMSAFNETVLNNVTVNGFDVFATVAPSGPAGAQIINFIVIG